MLCLCSMVFSHYYKFPNLICSFKPKKPHPSPSKPHIIPARDRVIDFGKYKGKMLGGLPSTYLKWVCKNLRAGDFEQWAKLADQVLQDPVYQDRLEWEFADSVLNGNKGGSLSRNESAVSQLLEISERFGWDNEDKDGWSRVNFELLGTSKGGRIPRMVLSSSSTCSNNGTVKEIEDLRAEKGEIDKILSESEHRRKQRRERAKLRSREAETAMKKDKSGIIRNTKDNFVNGLDIGVRKQEDRTVEIYNPFSGREALLKKVLNGKRFL